MLSRSDRYRARLLNAEAKPVNRWSLDDWALKLYQVYGQNNKHRPGMYLWMQIATEASQLAENVRRGRITEALRDNLVNLFGWLCAFVGKYLYEDEATLGSDPISTLLGAEEDASYSKWILQKYPRVCCACGERFCVCSAYRDTFERRKEGAGGRSHKNVLTQGYFRLREARRRALRQEEVSGFSQLTLDELIEEFIEIYGGGHQDLDLWKIAAHFQEEVGEAAHEIVVLSELAAFEEQAKKVKAQVDYGEILVEAFQKEGSPRLFENRMQRLSASGGTEIVAYIRQRSIKTLEEELADVFSWICAMLGKIGESFRNIREEPDRRYAFWKSLAERYHPDGSTVCFACGQSPCKLACRAVFFTRKLIREEVKEANRANEAHEERIQKILRESEKTVERIAQEELRDLVTGGQVEAARERAKQLYAERPASSTDYVYVLVRSVREADWDDAWELVKKDEDTEPGAYRLIAWMYWQLGEVEKAIEVAERGLATAVAKRRADADILKFKNSLAYYYAEARMMSKAKDALEYAREAVAGRPAEWGPLNTLGYVQIVFGESRDDILEGVATCEKARTMAENPTPEDFELFAKEVGEASRRIKKMAEDAAKRPTA